MALLGALAIVCAARPLLALRPARAAAADAAAARDRARRRRAYAAVARARAAGARDRGRAAPAGAAAADHDPRRRSGVQTQLDRADRAQRSRTTSSRRASAATRGDRCASELEPGSGQDPPLAVAQLAGARPTSCTRRGGRTGRSAGRRSRSASPPAPRPGRAGLPARRRRGVGGPRLPAGLVPLRRSRTTPTAMMGGGVCWLDYNNDGWLDLFAVNSLHDADLPAWQAHGGLPRARCSRTTTAGSGRQRGDARGPRRARRRLRRRRPERRRPHRPLRHDVDGRRALWNNGDGTFTGARASRASSRSAGTPAPR